MRSLLEEYQKREEQYKIIQYQQIQSPQKTPNNNNRQMVLYSPDSDVSFNTPREKLIDRLQRSEVYIIYYYLFFYSI